MLPVGLAIAAWLSSLVARKLRLSADSDLRARLDTAFAGGIGLATQVAQERARNISNVSVQNDILREVVAYVNRTVPGTIQDLKLTPERVTEIAKGRMGASALLPLPDPAAPAKIPTTSAPQVPGPVSGQISGQISGFLSGQGPRP